MSGLKPRSVRKPCGHSTCWRSALALAATCRLSQPAFARLCACGGGSGQPGFGSLADQVALKLAQRAEHMEDKSATRGRGIDGFGQRAEANTARFQSGSL